MSDRAAKIKEVERLRKVNELKALRASSVTPVAAPLGAPEALEQGGFGSGGRLPSKDGFLATVKEGLAEKLQALKDLPQDAMNFATSVGENIPVVGPAAVAGGERLGAGLAALTPGQPGYDDALAVIQQMNEQERAQKIEESPMAAGVAAPLAAAAMIPAPFVKGGGFKGAASRVGANTGLAVADDLTRGEVSEIPQDAGIVGGIQTAIEIAPMAKKTALNRALKAAFGQQKKAFVETAKGGKLEKTGRALLEADEAGEAVVKFGSTAEDIAPRAKAKKEFFGTKIGEVGKAIDEVVPQSVDGASMAAKVRSELDGIADNIQNKAVRDRLSAIADELEAKGPMSFAKAQLEKDSYRFKRTPDASNVLPQDVQNKVKMIIGDEMDAAVARVAEANGMPDLAEQYKRYKEAYGVYKPVANFAEDRALGDMANRVISPSDMYAAGTIGTGALLGGMLTGQGMGESGGAGTVAALAGAGAHNLARRRGSAAAAVTSKFLSDLLAKQPALFGRFRPQLAAAERKGSTALIGTHEALLKSPEYQGVIGLLSDEVAKEDGDVAVITHPALIAGYRQDIQNNAAMPSTEKAKALSDLNKNGFYEMDLMPYKSEFQRLTAEEQALPPNVGMEDLLRSLEFAQPGSAEFKKKDSEYNRAVISKYRPKAEDAMAQEVGPGADLMKRLETALANNVVDPMARAGFPDAGAALATIPTTLADLVVPQTAGDFAMAGMPVGKLARGAKAATKGGKTPLKIQRVSGTLKPKDMYQTIGHQVSPDETRGAVLRLQNADGRGPFENEAMINKWRDKGHEHSPGLDAEPGVQDMMMDAAESGADGQFRYGFSDEKQLKKYFTPTELAKLEKLGFFPTEVPATAIWRTPTQVIFEPKWVTELE